ncbi:MAG: SOS response-associated peptidase [Actinobacteria bacterium]|nr:SOS response-associated peptidase [Actinomycetota bacterium]
MCGRVVVYSPPSVIAGSIGARSLVADSELPPSWNIAPTRLLPVLYTDQVSRELLLDLCVWGFRPAWVGEDSKRPRQPSRLDRGDVTGRAVQSGPVLFNARLETAAVKAAFKEAFRSSRCLVAVDGFYEWHLENGTRQPYFFCRPDRGPIWLAGLWEPPPLQQAGLAELARRRGTCTILTRPAQGAVATVHDRMPVIVSKPARMPWLDPSSRDPAHLRKVIGESEETVLERLRVSRLVNQISNDSPELIAADCSDAVS